MAWRCHVGLPPQPDERVDPGRVWWRAELVPPQYGGLADADAWEYAQHYLLSPRYLRHALAVRLPLACWLPNGRHWLIDGLPTGGTTGWTVHGEPPAISVDPAVHVVARDTPEYFGILEHGWLSRDFLGNHYPELDPALDQDEPTFEMPSLDE